MIKPVIIFDPHWRQAEELFSEADLKALYALGDVVWGQNAPIPEDVYEAVLPKAEVLISASPSVTVETLAKAAKLRVVIEVSGAFPNTIDYAACAERGVEVLSCAPGFRQSVAEMGLAMALSGARGLVDEHEAFRRGEEGWLQDNTQTDFSLFGAKVGFVGYGQIARELARLMHPFRPEIIAYDPWLSAVDGVALTSLNEVFKTCRCVFVTAAPTASNHGLVSRELMELMLPNALLVVLSRAHLVDFDVLIDLASDGRIRVATDVFPEEPLASDHKLRGLPNVILSPHRAAAVAGGRQLIGEMIVDDLRAMMAGSDTRRLGRVPMDQIADLAGTGDAHKVSNMAAARV